jgi:hypothetical protein
MLPSSFSIKDVYIKPLPTIYTSFFRKKLKPTKKELALPLAKLPTNKTYVNLFFKKAAIF